MMCTNCGSLITFGGPPCCAKMPPRVPRGDYGFDYTKLLDTPPVDFSVVANRATRAISEAIEKLLQEWVAEGLPLDRAEPKWEFGDVEDMKLSVRVWIDWRELPGDVTVALPEGER